MLINESPRRRLKKARAEPIAVRRPLSPDEIQSLRQFVLWALGDGRLTAYEENFLNDRKHQIYRAPHPSGRTGDEAMWLSDKQKAIIRQIKDKLHYDCQEVPLPPIDPDGIVENDDPDGWPMATEVVDQFEDEELFA
jgi:hypothetical protein